MAQRNSLIRVQLQFSNTSRKNPQLPAGSTASLLTKVRSRRKIGASSQGRRKTLLVPSRCELQFLDRDVQAIALRNVLDFFLRIFVEKT
jgi:hypothetical protein